MTAKADAAEDLFSKAIPAWSAPVALALFALFLRMGLLWQTGFDGLYGQDPFAYFDYAATFRDALTHAQWPPAFFWPIGYPALAALLSTFVPLSAAAQTISIAAGVLVTVLAFLIVLDLLGDQRNATLAGLMTGVIVASAGQLLISSLCIMSDASGLFWVTLSAFALLRFRRHHSPAWIALAGFSLGWALITRWVYVLLIPVWGMALVVEIKVRALLRAGIIGGAFFLSALLPQGLLIAKQAGVETAAFMGDAQVSSWNPLNALQSEIVNADGHFKYSWTIGHFYSLPLVEPDYIPIWFTPLVLLGIWTLRRRRMELVLLLGWFGVMWGFLIGFPWENWRFPLAFFTPLAALAGIGLAGLFARISAKSVRLVGGWLGIGILVAIVWSMYDASAFIGRQFEERSIVNWVDERVPADATIFTFGETATLQHYTPFRIIEMASESPESTEALAREWKDVFVLLNVENVESQWQGLAPQVNFQVLRDRFVLQTIASRGAYRLYSVENGR